MISVPPKLRRPISGLALCLAVAYVIVFGVPIEIPTRETVGQIVFGLSLGLSPALLLVLLRYNATAICIFVPLVGLAVGGRIYLDIDYYLGAARPLFRDWAHWLGLLTVILAIVYLVCWMPVQLAVYLNRKWDAMQDLLRENGRIG